MSSLHIGPSSFGHFSGIYYIGYAFFHIPVSMFLDRYNLKIVLPILMLMAACGSLPLVYGDSFMLACIGRFFVGVGSSGAILSIFKVLKLCFPQDQFTKMLSFSVTLGLMGAIYGGLPVASINASLGYRYVVWLSLVVGVFIAVLAFLVSPSTVPEKKPIWSSIKEVIANKNIIIICLIAGLMVGPLEGFLDGWSMSFLTCVYGMSNESAAFIPSITYIGMGIGGPILSYINNIVKDELLVVTWSAVILCIVFTSMLVFHISVLLVPAFIIIGICSAYQIIAIYKASLYTPSNTITTAVANMIIMQFGYTFHTVIGRTIEANDDVVMGLFVIPIALFIAIVALLLRKRIIEEPTYSSNA